MKLFNKTIDRQLFKQYSLGSNLSKQEVVAKIFNPTGAGTWFILNSDPEDPDYLWAIVDLGYGAEVGSVSRSELENYRGRFGLGFERDLGFDPINAEELYQGLRNGEYFADGGGVEGYKPYIFFFYDENGNEQIFKTLAEATKEAKRQGQQKVRDNLGEEYFIQYADGGQIEVVYERRADFKNKPIKLLLLSRGKEQKGYTFRGKDQIAVLENYNRNKQEDLERLWDLKGYETKYADGGDIANFSDNQRMIMNQNVELEHHHEELEDILEDEVPVPAWVVAKMATATQSVSDITHYLDGQKEIMEDQLEEEDDDDDEDKMEAEDIENKEVVEPIVVTAGDKTEITKNFTDNAWGNLRGFLKGMEGIDLRDDYTFDYKDEQYEVEPIINSDENGVSNAVFSIFDGDGEEVGEVTYSREGGKQKFTANSEFFSWNNAKFEDGGFMNGVYADGGEISLWKAEPNNKPEKLKTFKSLSAYNTYMNKNRKLFSDEHFKNGTGFYGFESDVTQKEVESSIKNLYDSNNQYADGGYFDGAIPKVSTYMSTYAKGGEIAKAEILGLTKNILGTTSIEMKISGMRKPQEFSVYPIGKDDTEKIITIQSDTRIGKIDLSSGRGLMSQSHSNGAYFVHFQMDKLTPFTLSESDLQDLKMHIFKTAGSSVGNSIVKSDNSGASRLFADGGQIPEWLFVGVYPNAYIYADKRIENKGYYHEIGRIVFNPFQVRIFDNSSKYSSVIKMINKEAEELEKQGVVEISSTGQTTEIKKMSDGGWLDKYQVDRFKQVMNGKAIAKYIVRLQDSFGNKETYVFGIKLNDQFRGCELVPYENLYGGWSNSGTAFSLDNLQVERLVPYSFTNIELEEEETEMLVNKLVNNNQAGVEKFLNSQFFYLNYNQTFKDVLRGHFARSVVKVVSIEFEIAQKFADGGFMSDVYADGGITYYNNENQHRLGRASGSFEKEIFEKVKDRIDSESFVGNFGWKTPQGKRADGYLYKLDDFDKGLIKDLKLKQGEVVFRYVNRTTAIGGSTPFIKINLEKALLYFPVFNDNDDIIFETRGVTPLWISLIEGSFADGGYFDGAIPKTSSYMSNYANGGEVEQTQYVLFKTEKDLSKITNVLNEYDGHVNESDKIRNRNKLYHNVDGKKIIVFSNLSVDMILDLARNYGAEIEKYSKENYDNYAKGGGIEKVRWQEVEIGDSARVKELNRLGLIIHTYGRKFHLKFPNGTEKTFDASELEFFKLEKDEYEMDDNNNFAKGGNIYPKYVKVEKKDVSKFKQILNETGIKSPYSEDISDKQFNIEQIAFYFKNEDDRQKAFDSYHKSYAKGGNIKNYILKADIKTVTVKRKGKEVTYNGADVLNGAHVLAKGGDITSKANYVGKNDVVEVELKDGSKVKPANGYWIKKGAEPISNEPTPTTSGKSEPKVGETVIKKGAYGWSATTNIDDFNDYDWRVSTFKTSSGQLLTSAKGGKSEQGNGYTTFKYTLYEDPYHTLEVSKPSRLTDKVVSEQHAKGLAKFKKFMETGTFGRGGKISKFDKLSAKVAKQYEGKPVKSQYQEEYGKYYSKEEAQEVGDKVAGKMKAMTADKKENGGRISMKLANELAKEIRKDGESWNDAKKRAFAQLKK